MNGKRKTRENFFWTDKQIEQEDYTDKKIKTRPTLINDAKKGSFKARSASRCVRLFRKHSSYGKGLRARIRVGVRVRVRVRVRVGS
jgi:hypothetical protein